MSDEQGDWDEEDRVLIIVAPVALTLRSRSFLHSMMN